jgi:hypothetical protein
MGSGMEMMMSSLVKAIGFDPKQLQENVETFVSDVYRNLAAFDARMTALELQIARLIELNEAVLRAHGSHPEQGLHNVRTPGPVIDGEAEPIRRAVNGNGGY